MSRHNRERRRHRPDRRRHRPDRPRVQAPDFAALERLARYLGHSAPGPTCEVPALADCPGASLPVVEPRGPIADHMAFDRAVCAAGLKLFIRPATAGDWPEADREIDPALGRYTHVVVREMSEGVRVRSPVNFHPCHELN